MARPNAANNPTRDPIEAHSPSGCSTVVDQVCGRFEAAWKAGQPPRLADFLAEAPAAMRTELLRELLIVDICYRRKEGREPAESDYLPHFPEETERLRAAFAAARDEAARRTACHPASANTPPEAWGDSGSTHDAPMPQVLGDYEIVDRLGGGGMGIVYKAVHRRLHRTVALKVLRPEYLRQAEPVRRFLREMEAAGRLDHENLARITDAREEQGIHFLVMEYVEGEDLAKVLACRGGLPVGEACRIVRQTAAALQHAHERGLVHRDIKPSNLMLNAAGQVKVLDLGLARLRDKPSADLTVPGQVMGTLDYMAPEQAAGRSDLDIRADLYSLGCTFYHLLTGRRPYGDEYPSYSAKLLAHLQVPFPSVRATRPEVSEHLEAVIERLVAKDPADRFATPAELMAALAPHCQDEPAETVTLPPRPSRAVPSRGRPLLAMTCGAIAVLLLAGWFFVGSDGHRPPDAGRQIPSFDVPAAADQVTCVSATLWVRRSGDDASIRRLMIGREGSGETKFPPLGPDDDFKLAAEFSRPTDWCLVWLDTRGAVSLVAQSDAPTTTAEYPPGDQLVGVDPADPAGRHLLVLLASEQPVDGIRGELLTRLAALGQPPPALSEQYVQLRGPGEVSPSGVRLDPAFSERLQQSLPPGVYWVHQLSLPTVR